jgi:hypothetical protein
MSGWGPVRADGVRPGDLFRWSVEEHGELCIGNVPTGDGFRIISSFLDERVVRYRCFGQSVLWVSSAGAERHAYHVDPTVKMQA